MEHLYYAAFDILALEYGKAENVVNSHFDVRSFVVTPHGWINMRSEHDFLLTDQSKLLDRSRVRCVQNKLYSYLCNSIKVSDPFCFV